MKKLFLTVQKKKLIYKKKFGGVFIKRIMRYAKDYKKVDIHLPLKKEGFCPHTGKKAFKHFKNLY